MIDRVEFVGLALGPVAVGGAAGPVDVAPSGEDVVAVFRLKGWGAEDEARGHKVCRAMETVGGALADDFLSAEEAVEVLYILDHVRGIQARRWLPTVQKLFRALEDDGRVSRAEAVALVWELVAREIGKV